MATFNPYLNFKGNTEEAFNFYKSVFGGEFVAIQRFKETPFGDQVPADAKDKIMHVSLPIGKGNILMGTDALESMGHKLSYGNNFNISIEADSKEEARKLYDKLSIDGKIETPIHDEFWGAYFGMFTDRFGTRWMINYTYPKQK
ncbi:MAG TPA: VOC family protein [Candidatus Acidoferrales bacterium]|nr:VOC family protein [Candidatus Acidoferrales bacterium]